MNENQPVPGTGWRLLIDQRYLDTPAELTREMLEQYLRDIFFSRRERNRDIVLPRTAAAQMFHQALYEEASRFLASRPWHELLD